MQPIARNVRKTNSLPFIACAESNDQGFDSDTTYPISPEEGYTYREPSAPPINPPYKTALDIKHHASSSSS